MGRYKKIIIITWDSHPIQNYVIDLIYPFTFANGIFHQMSSIEYIENGRHFVQLKSVCTILNLPFLKKEAE